MKQSPSLSALTVLVMLSMLLLALCPSVAAMHTRDTARSADRTGAARHIRVGIRMEDGIVTDDDGLIGNGTRGADRAPLTHRAAHRRHHAHPTMSGAVEVAVVTSPDRLMPEPGNNPLGRAVDDMTDGLTDPMRGRTLPDELPGGANDGPADGGIANDDVADGGAADGNHAAGNDGSTTEDGTIEDGHAENGTVNDNSADEGMTEDENSSARSILPWVIGILVAIGAVLVILALVPRRRSR